MRLHEVLEQAASGTFRQESNEDVEFRIVEINNLNSAGWYSADMQKLVWALHELVEVPVIV